MLISEIRFSHPFSKGFGRVTMVDALNINATVGIFFDDWVEITEGETLEYEISLYEDADLTKVSYDVMWCVF